MATLESGESSPDPNARIKFDLLVSTTHRPPDGVDDRMSRLEGRFNPLMNPEEIFDQTYHVLSVRAIPGIVDPKEYTLNRIWMNFNPCVSCPLRKVMPDGSIRGPLECPSCETE